MMSYDVFKSVVTERIKEYLPQSFTFYDVDVHTVYKTNEKLDCMTLVPHGCVGKVMCPTVYLNERYEDFKECEDIDMILREIAWVIINYSAVIPEDFDFDLSGRKDHIVMNIMNTEKNEEFLSTVPHREILDFAIMYRMVIQLSHSGIDTIMITNQVAEELGMSEEDLFRAATKNTRDLFPVKILTIQEMCDGREMPEEEQDEYLKRHCEPFIVTNDSFINGSAYLAQPEILRRISKKIQDSYYAVPSSVNEFFVLPAENADLDSLRDMLRSGNSEATQIREVLSDNVYYYDRERQELMIA